MVYGMSPPIIEDAEGITFTSTGLIAIREHADFVDNALNGLASDTPRAFRLVMTINHEAVHFIQCFTTAFLYSYSLSLFDLTLRVIENIRRGFVSKGAVAHFREAFAGRVEQFKSRNGGFSAIDLVEAMAVTEGYRATVTDNLNNPRHFHQFLITSFPNPKSEYRRVIDFITRRFGESAGYNLTPRLCFLALNTESPSENLQYFVEWLKEVPSGDVASLTATELLEFFDMDLPILETAHQEFPEKPPHPILDPYIKALAATGPLQDRYEFAAQPGTWLRTKYVPERKMLLPPFIVASGGRGWIMGLASEWSGDKQALVLQATATIGACLMLLSGDTPYQACRHTECPVHQSALCYSWFAKPHALPWTECSFPWAMNDLFGRSVEELLALFGD
jgi:hypothetical protein